MSYLDDDGELLGDGWREAERARSLVELVVLDMESHEADDELEEEPVLLEVLHSGHTILQQSGLQ